MGEFGHSDVQIYSPIYLEHKAFSEVNMYTKKYTKYIVQWIFTVLLRVSIINRSWNWWKALWRSNNFIIFFLLTVNCISYFLMLNLASTNGIIQVVYTSYKLENSVYCYLE